MCSRNLTRVVLIFVCAALGMASQAQTSAGPHSKGHASALDAGSVTNGVYRNSGLGFSCKIPDGWVLRTDDMNSDDDDPNQPPSEVSGKVLLAAFSRPPEARAEDVNSSILIAAEPVSAYPGLKEAAQYLAPLEDVAKTQGFAVVGDPYEIQLGAKRIPREDFQKDVGTRVMRQATLVALEHGYAISFTFIGGTEDEVEQLVESLAFPQRPVARK